MEVRAKRSIFKRLAVPEATSSGVDGVAAISDSAAGALLRAGYANAARKIEAASARQIFKTAGIEIACANQRSKAARNFKLAPKPSRSL